MRARGGRLHHEGERRYRDVESAEQGAVGVGSLVCEAVFQAALNPDFGTIGGNGVQTDRLFIDGCIPLNLFGQNARSEAAREWVTGDRLTNTKIKQTVYNFNIGGELFDLPAGPLAVGTLAGCATQGMTTEDNILRRWAPNRLWNRVRSTIEVTSAAERSLWASSLRSLSHF